VSVFTDDEVAYLRAQRIGRLATADSKGRPHVVPAGFNVDADKGVQEIGVHNLPGRGRSAGTWPTSRRTPYVAFVVDHAVTEPSWAPRGATVCGRAVIHPDGGERLGRGFGPIWVEIAPEWVSGRESTPARWRGSTAGRSRRTRSGPRRLREPPGQAEFRSDPGFTGSIHEQ
jgi:pyridoxamine 5'-phosphate oxidase family protein